MRRFTAYNAPRWRRYRRWRECFIPSTQHEFHAIQSAFTVDAADIAGCGMTLRCLDFASTNLALYMPYAAQRTPLPAGGALL